MTHQGWDVQLTAYAARDWRANFLLVGHAHSIVGGSAWEPTAWLAVQTAAWAALGRLGNPLRPYAGRTPHRGRASLGPSVATGKPL
jgi:hypothetical protein